MFSFHLVMYIFAFLSVWFGSGLIISAMSKFSQKFKLSSFITSFVVLGLLTSIPEFAVGLQSIADKDPEIFVGNLIGGIPVIFLFVIPILAIFGNGINLKNELNRTSLLSCLAVIVMPSLFVIDKKISNIEGTIMVLLYFGLLLIVGQQEGLFSNKKTPLTNFKTYSFADIVKLLVGVGVVSLSSNAIVKQTLFFANWFQISAFYVSLIVVSVGTNLPELTLAIRSVITRKKDIAMGDYLGSAAVNTLFLGIFSLLTTGEVMMVKSFFFSSVFIATTLSLFYIFYHTKKRLSRIDGFIFLALYTLFVLFEFSR